MKEQKITQGTHAYFDGLNMYITFAIQSVKESVIRFQYTEVIVTDEILPNIKV